jgi:flagellar hook-associated protein 2
MGSTTSITAATFNGTSQYAGDLQKAITNAVNIASIPMNNLQDSVTTLQGQSSELSRLQTDFFNLGSAISSLDSASGNGLAASVSNSAVASATLIANSGATAGTYTLKVISPGAPTTTLSNNGLPTVSAPSSTSISTSGNYTLTVGTSTFTITPSANNLSALAQAINTAGDGVSATIVNIGSPSSPDYRLSLQSSGLGNETIQLYDGTQNLLSNLTTGSDAQYQVDGLPSPTPISSNSSTVTIAPGVTVSLLQAGTTTVSVTPDASAAETAISSFVSAYNSASAELGSNHGTLGGALTGQSIILTLEQSLQSLVNYSGGSGSVQSLADLGITIDSTGAMSFDQATFQSVAASDPNDLATFLGSASSGTGFLGTAINTLNGIDDATNGTVQSVINTTQQQIASDNALITADQSSITTMQNSLTEQMSLADASIASLESQVTYYNSFFADANYVSNSIANG